MNHYIIDGNNLIGKIAPLMQLQRKDKQASREGLVSLLNNFLAGKKIKLTLHFDGFANTALPLFKGRIVYSDKRTSDSKIREEIDQSKNPKKIVMVSSDHSIMNYARVCSCKVVKSEDFYTEIKNSNIISDEKEKVKMLENENALFLKLFSQKNS